MQILLSKRIDVHALTEEVKHELKFLWLPIIEHFPKRLIWLEWVTYGYNKDTQGRWIKISTMFHGSRKPESGLTMRAPDRRGRSDADEGHESGGG